MHWIYNKCRFRTTEVVNQLIINMAAENTNNHHRIVSLAISLQALLDSDSEDEDDELHVDALTVLDATAVSSR